MVTEHDAKQNMSLVTQEMPAAGEGQDVQEPLQVARPLRRAARVIVFANAPPCDLRAYERSRVMVEVPWGVESWCREVG